MSTFETARGVVAESLGIDPDDILPESSFRGNLGADSMDIAQLILDLEEAFEMEIPEDDAEKLLTVQDVVNYIDRQ